MSTRGITFKFYAGEVVLCFEPDPTKARVIYEAKILDTTVYRDEEGRKQPGYHIHFLRWNNSWDRVVSEWFVLKDTDNNRVLMRQLADVARKVRKNQSRRKKIGEILSRAFDGKPPGFESGSEEESDEGNTTDANGTEDETSATESLTDSMDSLPKLEDKDASKWVARTHTVELNIPESLKTVLDKDYFAVNHDDKLVRLPADINVVTVLESFVKMFTLDFWSASFDRTHFCHTPPKISMDRVLPVCKEFVDGLRICFDFALPLVLLYGAEKSQYDKITASYKHKSPAKSKLPPPEESPLIQSPRLRSVGRGSSSLDEPSPKLPKLSPNGLSDSDNDSEVTFRPHCPTPPRMTRRSLHDRKLDKPGSRQAAPDTRESKTPDKKKTSVETPISSRTRRSSDKSAETPSKRKKRKQRKSRETSNDSDTSKSDTQSEQQKTPNHKSEKETPERPPPLLIPCEISATQENGTGKVAEDKGDKGNGGSTDSLGESGKEEILDSILAWQMLPDDIQKLLPTPPTLLYGAHHLLRLFVKLPELLSKMKIEDNKLGVLLKLLQQFLNYLSEHILELFPDTSYMAA